MHPGSLRTDQAGLSSWRSLRSVMLLTVHVAAVAYVIRSLATPRTVAGSWFWVPLTISLAVLVSWPIGRGIASAFEPAEPGWDRACPRCGRREVRPLLRPGVGLFHPVTSYRCAACWTTLRASGDSWVVEPGSREPGPVDPSGIAYLSDPPGEDDIRYFDDKTDPI